MSTVYTFCLSTYLLRDTWAASTFLLLWILLQWISVQSICSSLCFQFFGVYPERNCWIIWEFCLIFWGIKQNCLAQWLCHLTLLWQHTGVSISPHPHQRLLFSVFLTTVILTGYLHLFLSPRGFPAGSVVKSLPANPGDTHRFDPRSRKIPHAPE